MTYINSKTNERIEAEQEFISSLHDELDWQLEIVVVPLPTAKAEKQASLNKWHDQQVQGMRAKYSESEFESFLDKRNEAMAYRNDPLAKTPYIDAMAGGVAEVRTMLLTSILAKVDATAQLEMFVLTKRDAIDACVTQAELDAIVW